MKKRVNISMQKHLLGKIDERASGLGLSRSAYLSMCANKLLDDDMAYQKGMNAIAKQQKRIIWNEY